MLKSKFLNQLLCPLSNVSKIRRQLVPRVMLLNNSKFVKHSSRGRISTLSPTSSPGLIPQKMGGAGKGPGIGWSRVQSKYSCEANLYAILGATRWFCTDRSE